MRHLYIRTAYFLALVGLLTPLAVQGQVQQGQQGQRSPQAIQLSPEQIQSAAQAFVEIQELRQQYRDEYGSLSEMDSSKVAEIQSQFRQETQQAMKDAGVTQQKFQMVMQLMQANDNIKQQFFAAVKEAGGQPPQLPDRSQQRQQQRRQQQAPQVDVSEQELQKIANAFVAIQEIRQKYQDEHGSVEDSTKMRQLQKQFRAETQQAIQEEDVSQQQFSRVLRAARSDSALRERFFSAVEEAGGEVPGPSGQ